MNPAENKFLFTGVVEDIIDPEQLGRVRVRVFGVHSSDVLELPVEALPWSSVIMPVTSASIGGIGQSATGLLQGSWVTGYFRDGTDAQDPVILGSIPGKSTRPHESSSDAFIDRNRAHPLREGHDTPSAAHSDNYTSSSSYIRKGALEISKIQNAMAPTLSSIDPLTPPPAARTEWSIPSVKDTNAPVYPNNHVQQTLAGHVFEVDDTPGSERISTMHCSGTHTETVANGSQKVVVVGSGYRCVLKDDNIYVEGNCNITIAGNARTLVKGNYNLEVEGNMTEYIKGSKLQKIGGSHKSEISGEVASNIAGNRKVTVNANDELNTVGDSIRVIGGNEQSSVSGDTSLLTIGKNTIAIGGNSITAVGGTFGMSSFGNSTITAASIDFVTT